MFKASLFSTQEFEVTLRKSETGGLGFTVAGGATTTGGCYVKAVVLEPALSDGRLRPGDKLIRVQFFLTRSKHALSCKTG